MFRKLFLSPARYNIYLFAFFAIFFAYYFFFSQGLQHLNLRGNELAALPESFCDLEELHTCSLTGVFCADLILGKSMEPMFVLILGAPCSNFFHFFLFVVVKKTNRTKNDHI